MQRRLLSLVVPVARAAGDKLSLRERCRVRDEEHVATLERIAADDTHPGFQLVAIRDLMDRGWGRPSQMVEGTSPGDAIPFTVVLPVAISNDDD